MTPRTLKQARPSNHFNSHARVGRDVRPEPNPLRLSISTHTPAWGVTLKPRISYSLNCISTHTPAWGVTFLDVDNVKRLAISTHTPAWGVTQNCRRPTCDRGISTHTPAWGVTARMSQAWNRLNISTHTPAWGVTEGPVISASRTAFQLTRPRGA